MRMFLFVLFLNLIYNNNKERLLFASNFERKKKEKEIPGTWSCPDATSNSPPIQDDGASWRKGYGSVWFQPLVD